MFAASVPGSYWNAVGECFYFMKVSKRRRWLTTVRDGLLRLNGRPVLIIALILLIFVMIWFMRPIGTLHAAQLVAEPNKEGVNLYVAIGTGVAAVATVILAFFTWRTLRASLLTSQDERRRHQQSLAPVLEIVAVVENGDLIEVIVRNAGLGLAQQAALEVRGFYRNPVTGTGFDISHYEPRSILAVNDQWRNAMTQTLSRHGTLRADGFGMWAVLTYRDIFNNTYYTITQDVMRRGEMEWIRPVSIYPDRSHFEETWADKHDMANLIECLGYNGSVSRDGSP